MSAERLLAYYDRFADSPDAIPRLRRLVLDLAVRGKLVSQVPKDEPAPELLKRIETEKARLVKAGDVRKPRDLDSGEAIEEPFPIPSTWQWVRLDAVGAIVGGGTPPATDEANFAEPGEGTPWLTPADLGGYSDHYISRGARDLSEKGLRTSSATVMPKGTVLFTSRAPIGYVAIAANPISTNQGFKSVVPYVGDCSRFIATTLSAFARDIAAKAPGTTFKEVSGKIVAAIPFPLPPLAEQHRISAKVDELMALCDQLEAARADREATRDRLTTASLARLNAPDPVTFCADARFALDNVAPLTIRPDQIKQLRQTVLSLAVRGKLVPQDPRDEQASELLERIAKEKARLVKEGELKRTKELEPLSDAETSVGLPRGWEWTRLGRAYDVRDGTHDTPKYVDVGVPLITSKNLSSGCLSFADVKLISERDHRQISERSRVDKGDVLLAMIGSIGNPVIVDTDRPFSIKNVALFKYYDRELSSAGFLRHFLQYAAIQMKDLAAGGLQPFVSLGFLRAYPLALPPLAEQRRIVAKVDELMALLDQLEAQLTVSRSTATALMDAVVAELTKAA